MPAGPSPVASALRAGPVPLVCANTAFAALAGLARVKLPARPLPFVVAATAFEALFGLLMVKKPSGPVPVCLMASAAVGAAVETLWLMGSAIVPCVVTPLGAAPSDASCVDACESVRVMSVASD